MSVTLAAREFARSVLLVHFRSSSTDRAEVLVPVEPARHGVGLDSETVVVGSRDHLELWSPERWTTYSAGWTSPMSSPRTLTGLEI